MRNQPEIWKSCWPVLQPDGHKYHRGHVLVNGSPLEGSGASKLAAEAALRSGAGLVTVACDTAALPAYAAAFKSIMVKQVENMAEIAALIQRKRINAVVIGCGNGVSETTRQRVTSLLANDALKLVLDADALTVFASDAEELFAMLHEGCVLTPHEGEFARLFPQLSGEREARAREAAKLSGAVVVLKVAQTVIASPDGRVAINDNAPPTLATAGSGDVLAGMIAGLLAQGMPAYEAACAGVYLHGECANTIGHRFIAEDLLVQIGRVFG